jgi:hypothetical protein
MSYNACGNATTQVLGASSAPDASGSIFSTAIVLVQAAAFLVLGTCTCFFGPQVSKTLIVMESALASGYLVLVDSLLVVSVSTVDVVWTNLVALSTGTLALAFTALQNPSAALVMKGVLLGYQLSSPLIALVRDTLYREWAGCTGFGARTERHPSGEPQGCDASSGPFLAAFYGCFVLRWLLSIGSALVARHARTQALLLSSAVTGATMFTHSFAELTCETMLHQPAHWALADVAWAGPLLTWHGLRMTWHGPRWSADDAPHTR